MGVGPDVTVLFGLPGGEAFGESLPAGFELFCVVRCVVLLAQALEDLPRVLQERWSA